MILFLGASDGSWQPINIPDVPPNGYTVAEAVEMLPSLLPELWWGPGQPVWVASDTSELATVAAKHYGVPVQDPPPPVQVTRS